MTSPDVYIAVIECKLAANPEIKRKVIGQLLEYAAYLWELDYDGLDEGVRLRTGQALADLVGKRVHDPDWDEETFRRTVTATLRSGNFILMIVVDEITPELVRIVRFVNDCGSPSFEFAALEMRRFQGEGAEMLVPRVFGPLLSEKSRPLGEPVEVWDETRFFAELERRHGELAVTAARGLLDWAQRDLQVWWGKGKRTGSFVPLLVHKDVHHQLFAVYTYGVVEIYFQWYVYKPPFDTEEKRLELWEKLNRLEGVNIPRDGLTRRPSFPLKALAEGDNLARFLAIYDWVVAEIKKT